MADASNAKKSATTTLVQEKIASTTGKEQAFWRKFLQTLDNSAGQVDTGLGAMTWETTRAVEEVQRVSGYIQEQIQSATSSIVSGISGLQADLTEGIHNSPGLPDELTSITKPISQAMGSTVNTATAIIKNPLGAPQYLANGMTAIIDKINPNFANQLDSSFKSVNLENLQHLPSKMMGSLRNLVTAADALLAVPFELLSDMYNGLLEIMDAIAELIDGLVTAALNFLVEKIIFSILDSTLFLEIKEFLDTIGELASYVGGISQLSGGFAVVADVANQVSSYSSSFTSALNDPLQTAISYFPALQQAEQGFGQVTGALRDPESVLKQYLPPEISQQMQKISQIPGLGFVGNLGYSVGDTLDTLSNGIFATALKSYSQQAPMLGPLFNQRTEPTENDFAQEAHADGYQQGEHRPDQQVYQTAPTTAVGAEATKKLLPEKTANREETTAYEVTEVKENGKVVSITAPGSSTNRNTTTAYGITGQTRQ